MAACLWLLSCTWEHCHQKQTYHTPAPAAHTTTPPATREYWLLSVHIFSSDSSPKDRLHGYCDSLGEIKCCLDPTLHAPVEDVVIFPTPAPVLVRKAIDLQKLCLAQARDASKIASIWQPARDKQERQGSVKLGMGFGVENLDYLAGPAAV